jgi:hypothetical protein
MAVLYTKLATPFRCAQQEGCTNTFNAFDATHATQDMRNCNLFPAMQYTQEIPKMFDARVID